MAVSRPLAVAIAAMVLLVGSVTFEAVFHRTYAVEIHGAIGWQTIGSAGAEPDGKRAVFPAAQTIVADRNATLEFRFRVDNGYPWSYADHYNVLYAGVGVAEGDIAAGGRGVGLSTFTIPASTFYANLGLEFKGGGPGGNVTFPSLDVQVGNVDVPASFQLQLPGGS